MKNTDPLSLAEIRKSFGWTQEDIADHLNVAVSTVSRWERSKTKQPQIAGVSRLTNRRLSYLLAMVDNEFILDVEGSEGFDAIFHGKDLFFVAASKKGMSKKPVLRQIIGFPIVPLLVGEGKRVFNENVELFIKAVEECNCSLWWWAPVQNRLSTMGLMNQGLELVANFMPGSVIHMQGRLLDPEESKNNPVGRMEFRGLPGSNYA